MKEDEEANIAAATALKNHGLEWAAQKLERKERITREEAEKKEKEWAAIDVKLQKLMAKKAELDTPAEPKKEPVGEMVPTAKFMAEFPCPPGWSMGTWCSMKSRTHTRTLIMNWSTISVNCRILRKIVDPFS
jgi:hypothetical protein